MYTHAPTNTHRETAPKKFFKMLVSLLRFEKHCITTVSMVKRERQYFPKGKATLSWEREGEETSALEN